MKTGTEASSGSIAAQWRHHLRHASWKYWIAQAVMVGLYMALTAVMLVGFSPVEGSGPRHPGQAFVRVLVDIGLMIAILHVFVRPMLLIFFVHRKVSWKPVVTGLAVLLVLGYVQVLASALFGKLFTPRDGLNFDQIRFHAGDTAYDFDIGTSQLLMLAGFNQFTMLLLWAMLYLAWKAFEMRRQLQQQVREARLRQLTHQLSPHFLFNSFNTIRGMIFEDRERAAELVTQLSELFRFHLSSELRTEATLAEDWEIARRYLDLEAVRLESRLRLEVDLPPGLMQRKLPALTLLTLVENAIKHGIAPNRDGGDLRIAAKPLADGWQLEVDNSVGRGRAEHSGGHGLANLRERLSLTRGDPHGLRVEDGNGRFLVRMAFPA